MKKIREIYVIFSVISAPILLAALISLSIFERSAAMAIATNTTDGFWKHQILCVVANYENLPRFGCRETYPLVSKLIKIRAAK